MSVFILIVPIFIFFVLVLIFGEQASEISGLCVLPILFIIGWVITASVQDWRVEKEITATIVSNDSDNSQVASFKDGSSYQTVNLNSLFNRVISDEQSVRVIKYDSGPYFGLYYPVGYSYVLMDKNNVALEVK